MAKILSEAAAGRKNVPQPNSACVTAVPVEVNFVAAAIGVGDIVSLVELPPGVQLVDYTVIAPALGGTPAFSIGEENAGGTDLAVVYEAALAATDDVIRCSAPNAAAASVTNARRIALKATAAATAANGKTLLVILHLRG